MVRVEKFLKKKFKFLNIFEKSKKAANLLKSAQNKKINHVPGEETFEFPKILKIPNIFQNFQKVHKRHK